MAWLAPALPAGLWFMAGDGLPGGLEGLGGLFLWRQAMEIFPLAIFGKKHGIWGHIALIKAEWQYHKLTYGKHATEATISSIVF